MDNNRKRELERLIQENDTKDQTQSIKERKHSSKLRDQVLTLYAIKYKQQHKSMEAMQEMIKRECEFLYTDYRELYEILTTKHMDLGMMLKMLELLGNIENSKMTQHESSFALGQMLKEMYIDPKINQRVEELDDNNEVIDVEPIELSWKHYKIMNMK